MVARTKVAALDKAARTAIILSGLFGFLIFFVKDVQPAVFGTFADLVMANYDPERNKRVVQVITLTIGETAVSMRLRVGIEARTKQIDLKIAGAAVYVLDPNRYLRSNWKSGD